MTLKYYNAGEHPGGFVGYRDTVTFGWSHLRQESYFSTRDFGEKEAKALAENEHERLLDLAKKVVSEDRIYKKRTCSGPQVIADGFRASIDPRTKNGTTSYMFYFGVDPDDVLARKAGTIKFNAGGGYDQAFENAVATYAKLRGLTKDEAAELRSRKPAPALFLDYLAPHLRQKGYSISDEFICQKLDIPPYKTNEHPKKIDIEAVLSEIKREKLPFLVYFNKLVLFWRSRVDKCYYKEYVYTEWGGIRKSMEAARRQFEQFITSERIILQNKKNEIQATDCIKLDQFKDGKGRYRVYIKGKTVVSYTFDMSDDCADTQFHAYRTAVYVAAFLLMGDDISGMASWRQYRIYEPGTPELPLEFWGPATTPRKSVAEMRKIILKIIKRSGLQHLFIDLSQNRRNKALEHAR